MASLPSTSPPAGESLCAPLLNESATLRVNQDCLDVVVEFAVSTPAELRQFRLLAAAFTRAVSNLLAYQLCRRRLTGPPPHPSGASLTLRGIDGVRLQLPTASDEEVMRHVLAFAGDVITRIDPNAFRYLSVLQGSEVAYSRLRHALTDLTALTEATVRVDTGREGEDFGVASVMRLPPTVTKLNVNGASPRLFDAVTAALPQIETLQLCHVMADDLLPHVIENDRLCDDGPALPCLKHVYVGNAEHDLAMQFVRRFAMNTTLVSVALPFNELNVADATLLRVLNGPSVRQLRTADFFGVYVPLPNGLSADTRRRLESLRGFVVPHSTVSSLQSLERFDFRLPEEALSVRHNVDDGTPHELPLVKRYAADLAKACGASLVRISLDADRRDAAAVVDAFTDGYAAELNRCPLRSFIVLDVEPDGETALEGIRSIPLRAFSPQRFPELRTLCVNSLPWDPTGIAETSLSALWSDVNVNVPASLEVLTAIGRVAGASIQELDVDVGRGMRRDGNTVIVQDAAGVLAAHFTALEYLTAPKLRVSGWRCSNHQLLRHVSVAIDQQAVTEFIAQVAQCPLIERVRVRDEDGSAFETSIHQPPHRNVLWPFRVHPCPRLVAVNGIYDCDPPREGGEFVLKSGGLLWELTSFG